jgi:HSP20 family protein
MTTMIKWAPFRELDVFDRRFRRLFEDFGLAPVVPAADVYETPEEFVVELEVPGYAEKELGIEVTDHLLTVKGERAETREQKEKAAFLLHERLERHFERRFELPVDADTDAVKAVFKQGVLEIRAPKAIEAKARKKIAIGA